MSEKSKLPDYKAAFESGGGADTERGAIALPLITKDKNLSTKTQVPDGFVMSVLDTIEEMAKGEIVTVAGLMKFWGEAYRVDMMVERGWSTANYVSVASAPLSLTDARIAETQERMKEGAKR